MSAMHTSGHNTVPKTPTTRETSEDELRLYTKT